MVWTHSEFRGIYTLRSTGWTSDSSSDLIWTSYSPQEPSFIYLYLFQIPVEDRDAFIWWHPETSASFIHAFVQQMFIEHILCARHRVKFRKTERNVPQHWLKGAVVEACVWGSEGMERRGPASVRWSRDALLLVWNSTRKNSSAVSFSIFPPVNMTNVSGLFYSTPSLCHCFYKRPRDSVFQITTAVAIFALQGTFGNIWKHFWLSWL